MSERAPSLEDFDLGPELEEWKDAGLVAVQVFVDRWQAFYEFCDAKVIDASLPDGGAQSRSAER